MNGMRGELPAPSIREGFGHRKTRNPAALAAAIAIHLGVAGVVMMMPGVEIIPREYKPIWITPIDAPKPPPPEAKVEPQKRQPLQKTIQQDERVTTVPPVIPLSGTGEPATGGPAAGTGETGTATGTTTPDPAPPVMAGARIDPRFADRFQPDYPAAMLRLGREGSVTVRVSIGTDGRVIEVALVRADDPAFYEATRRHALRNWRFRPATRDGQAIASSREMTVHFRIEGP